jgi:hypothetical protein
MIIARNLVQGNAQRRPLGSTGGTDRPSGEERAPVKIGRSTTSIRDHERQVGPSELLLVAEAGLVEALYSDRTRDEGP